MVTTNIRARCTNWNVIVKKSLETGNRKNTVCIYVSNRIIIFMNYSAVFLFSSFFFFAVF